MMKSALLLAAAAAFGFAALAPASAAPGGATTAPAIAQPPMSGHNNPSTAQPSPTPGEPKAAQPGMGTTPKDSGPSCTQNIAPGQPPGCLGDPNPTPAPDPVTPK